MMHNGWMPGEWGEMSPFMGGVMLLFWGVVIYAMVTIVRNMRRTNSETGRGKRDETPLDILKKRYAAGEIDREEYERIKKDLE